MKRFILTAVFILFASAFCFADNGTHASDLPDMPSGCIERDSHQASQLNLISQTLMGLPVGEECVTLNTPIASNVRTLAQRETKRIQTIIDTALHRSGINCARITYSFCSTLSFSRGISIFGHHQLRC